MRTADTGDRLQKRICGQGIKQLEFCLEHGRIKAVCYAQIAKADLEYPLDRIGGDRMEKTIGLAELTSITYGIAASDAMLKAGQVRMLRSASMCPGKYLIVIGGDTGEVKAAMEAGSALAGKHMRNSYVIPHIHEQVLDALSKKSRVEPREAVGILESSMMVSAIYAADMAVKQAAVRLCRVRLGQGIGGKGVVIVAGDVGAVNAAVKAAVDASETMNLRLTEHYVIPNPDPELLDFI